MLKLEIRDKSHVLNLIGQFYQQLYSRSFPALDEIRKNLTL